MDQNNAQQEGQGANAPVDPRGQAMRDAMWKGHGGFEIALVPCFGGLAGWVLDDLLSITPILTIVLATAGLGGAVANQYYRYVASMEIATAERLAAQEAKTPQSNSSHASPSQPFGAVEQAEVDMSIDFSQRPVFDPEAAL